MKLTSSIVRRRAGAAYLLVECLVYLVVFVLLLGLATAAFYACWDNSKALHYATDDIVTALRMGERWRADIRSATGKISAENTTKGEQLRIPCGTDEIVYRFGAGEVRRQLASSDAPPSLLATVKASQMVMDQRGPVTAWRWELELKSRRKESHLPLLFTFEAVTPARP